MAGKAVKQRQSDVGRKRHRLEAGATGAALRIPAGVVVRVTRGGDGGAAVPEAMLHRGSFAHDADNARVVLVAVGEHRAPLTPTLTPTADPFDCAHNQRAPGGTRYLEQGNGHVRAGLEGAPRRMYPRSQLVSSGVSIDSMFDGLAARVERLEREGLTCSRVGAIETSFLARELDARLRSGVRLRDVLHQRTACAMDEGELELERAGSAWLERGG